MSADLIHDRGRGPELIGTRITVYNLLPYLLDPDVTEASLAQLYELTPVQIAAARAYALNHAESVMAEHRRIEAELATPNPPEVIEWMERAHARLEAYKEWRAIRAAAEQNGRDDLGHAEPVESPSERIQAFKLWLADQTLRSEVGS